jgi:hypothetical protein
MEDIWTKNAGEIKFNIMKITLSNTLLDCLHTEHVQYIHPDMQQWFHGLSGQEHYRVLMHLAFCYDGVDIADIGTYRGASAIALAQNPNNKVLSLDIGVFRNEIPMNNIEFCIGDFRTNTEIQNKILKCPFIMLDIDHLYNNEIWFYNFLKESGWKGTMLCDDINLNEEMKRFWNEITHPKLDITNYGHFSGTGIVLFDDQVQFNLV